MATEPTEASPRAVAAAHGAIPLPVRFLIAGGLAACVNFVTRLMFSLLTSFAVAIVLGFIAGLATAFLLNRQFVFPPSQNSLQVQVFWFVAVNLLALVQTLFVSLLLAKALPAVGIARHAEDVAHAIGIAVPIFTSYVAHRRLTFR